MGAIRSFAIRLVSHRPEIGLMNTSFPAQPDKKYSPREEAANAATHGFGLAAGIVGLYFLLDAAANSGDVWRITGNAVFGVSLIVLYSTSTLYHLSRNPEKKRLFRLFDHAAIFLLIAGTYSPFLLVNIRGGWGWWLFGIVWGIALAGIIFKIYYRARYPKLSLVLYLGMGWLCVVGFHKFYAGISTDSLLLLVAGGLCYTSGVFFYRRERMPFHHAVWHLFVLAGSAFHYFAVLYNV
jgi:hemolysin III